MTRWYRCGKKSSEKPLRWPGFYTQCIKFSGSNQEPLSCIPFTSTLFGASHLKVKLPQIAASQLDFFFFFLAPRIRSATPDIHSTHFPSAEMSTALISQSLNGTLTAFGRTRSSRDSLLRQFSPLRSRLMPEMWRVAIYAPLKRGWTIHKTHVKNCLGKNDESLLL